MPSSRVNRTNGSCFIPIIRASLSLSLFVAFLDQLNQLKLLGHLQDFFSHSNHVYLILDGINHEQCDTEGQTITEFLFTNLHRLPVWLKLIITMNRLDTEQFQAEQNTFLQHFALFEFDDEGRLGTHLHNDIREYLSKRLEVGSFTPFSMFELFVSRLERMQQ